MTFLVGLHTQNFTSRWLADSSDVRLLGEQSSPKWEIPCLGRRWTAVQNSMPLALFSAEKSATVQTQNYKQTVTDISSPCLLACVDNKHISAHHFVKIEINLCCIFHGCQQQAAVCVFPDAESHCSVFAEPEAGKDAWCDVGGHDHVCKFTWQGGNYWAAKWSRDWRPCYSWGISRYRTALYVPRLSHQIRVDSV